MKKLKIFLLLSILLCFGFTLSFEVHAQSVGPKTFEGGDILPATAQLKISWDNTFDFTDYDTESFISSYNQFVIVVGYNEDYDVYIFALYLPNDTIYMVDDSVWQSPYSEYGGSGQSYVIIDTSQFPEEDRTINPNSDTISGLYWEDLNAPPAPSGPKIFEEEDVLPQGIIRVSWDEPNWFYMGELIGGDSDGAQIKSSNNSYNFIDRIDNNYLIGGINIMFIPAPGNLQFYPPYTVYGEGHAYVDINTVEWDLAKRTISTVYWGERLTSRLYWEDITPDGYTQGYLEAMEEYGYNDPITDQWLSVEEYLDLYGTDKPGQSDFYNNFDKYFIPAMIIVFGGAIVLTILKVFKGRE